MVYNSKDGVISMAVGELSDQVHGDNFEWLHEGWYTYLVLWHGCGVCEGFVLLASCASFDVVLNPFRHGRPPGDSFGGIDGPVSSCMCASWFVVY